MTIGGVAGGGVCIVGIFRRTCLVCLGTCGRVCLRASLLLLRRRLWALIRRIDGRVLLRLLGIYRACGCMVRRRAVGSMPGGGLVLVRVRILIVIRGIS
jgi:hypothetical protein